MMWAGLTLLTLAQLALARPQAQDWSATTQKPAPLSLYCNVTGA